jgi:hypothetical protein
LNLQLTAASETIFKNLSDFPTIALAFIADVTDTVPIGQTNATQTQEQAKDVPDSRNDEDPRI